eukprot:CAMPEP_0184365374 /NCGR_PEP_ID=MMETSP1089-20130417/148424_1 /TAXON_ID=38269 ORGANISM="Gloeochaete wittrockiana, Strain SAG46.84" /NCGR_SAMPLE_ID=MMETSP1089 /ASSEMBLY_ACC=CAM_ASM_000445 /LENGTH=195 /DNA_ID=CAMNT_0026706557 /DNA_START=80 /DNA_END=664 /DNA_ORIENTATION=-
MTNDSTSSSNNTTAAPLTPPSSSTSSSSSNGNDSPRTPETSSAAKQIQTPSTLKRVNQALEDFNGQKLKGEELKKVFGSCLSSLIARSNSDPNSEILVETFLLEGADPDGADSELSPLYVATDLRKTDTIKLLLANGASVLRPNKNSTADFPLANAFADPYSEVAKIYRDHIAELERLRLHSSARKRLVAEKVVS